MTTAFAHDVEHELRDHDGKWTKTPGGALHDVQKLASGLTGQAALDAAPTKLTRAEHGHSGDYAGEKLDGPPGVGSARAMSEYQGLEYGVTNDMLRHPGNADAESADWGKEALARIDDIDKTMAVSPLKADVVVHRVVRDGRATFGKQAWYGHIVDLDEPDFDEQDRQWAKWEAGERPDLTGLTWNDKAYSSTSVDEQAVKNFGARWPGVASLNGGEPVIVKIHVPAGTHGVALSEIGHEAEILLERGLTFEVTADHGVDGDGFRRLDVKVVPRG